jgi:glycosyltransferase involved in cell wall biosynthesis
VAAAARPVSVLAWPAFRKEAANPVVALLYRQVQRLGLNVGDWTPVRAFTERADIWHFHHPDTVVYPRSTVRCVAGILLLFIALRFAKWRGTRIVWTVHDVRAHDSLHPQLEALFWRIFVPAVDAYVCIAESCRMQILESHPGLRQRPGFVCGLGHYREAYANVFERSQARAHLKLPLEAVVLLHFGLIRPYKNVPHLIDTVRRLGQVDLTLLVAGQPFDPIVEREIHEYASKVRGVRLFLRWIPPDEVPLFFAACDLVVLPYLRILNSGALRLAMSLGRPALVPALGLMQEEQTLFGSDWVRLYQGVLDANELGAAIAWARECKRPELPSNLSTLDWSKCAAETCAMYDALLTDSASGPH